MNIIKFLFFALFLTTISCGTIQSVSAIKEADKSRETALEKIIESTGDESLLITGSYGYKTLSPKAGGEASYNFFMASAYLKKARDLQSKSQHERAVQLAEKSRDFSHKALTLLNSMNKKQEESPKQIKSQTLQERAPKIDIDSVKKNELEESSRNKGELK